MFAFQNSELLQILLKQSYTNTVKVEVFFSLERFSVFDWILIIVAVAGGIRNTMKSSHNIEQIPFQI